jgi:hypothetical protein
MPRTHDYQKLYAHIDALVEYGLEYQTKYVAEYEQEMSVGVFAKEFRTVGVNLPRRSGKSTYIGSRATEEDVIIVAYYEMKRMFMQAHSPKAEVIYAGQTLERDHVRRVYIDEPRLCDLRELPFIGKAQQYILLGTH